MRFALAVAFAWLMPAVSSAQTKGAADANELKQGTLKYLYALQDPSGGFYLAAGHPTVDGMPGSPTLMATTAAVRAIKYFGGTVPNEDKVKAFVRKCYRTYKAPGKHGGFGNQPFKNEGVGFQTTAMGLMTATDLGMPKEEFAGAQNRLMDARTFAEAQLAAAVLESLGVKGTDEAVARWLDLAEEYGQSANIPAKDGGAKRTSLLVILQLRLGAELRSREGVLKILREGQRGDGAWLRETPSGGFSDPARLKSDLESTYRVMRAFRMLKEKPSDPEKVREFIGKCRNADGGYGVSPGEPSNVQAVYFAAVISHWLDEMQK